MVWWLDGDIGWVADERDGVLGAANPTLAVVKHTGRLRLQGRKILAATRWQHLLAAVRGWCWMKRVAKTTVA